MKLTLDFIRKAVAPVIFAMGQSLVAPAGVSVEPAQIPEEPALVQMVKSPHQTENATLTYAFYKKRLGDAREESYVATYQQMRQNQPVATAPPSPV